MLLDLLVQLVSDIVLHLALKQIRTDTLHDAADQRLEPVDNSGRRSTLVGADGDRRTLCTIDRDRVLATAGTGSSTGRGES